MKHAYYGMLGIEEESFIESPIQLLGAFPNPSCGSIEIRSFLTVSSYVDIQVFDLSGRMVNTADGEYGQGQHSYVLNNPSSGMYFAQLRSGDFNTTERFVIIDFR